MPNLSNQTKYYIAKNGPLMETVSKTGLINKINAGYAELRELEQIGQQNSARYDKILGEFLAAHYALPMAEDESDVELDKPFDRAMHVLHLDEEEVGRLYEEMKELGFDAEKYNPEKGQNLDAPVDEGPILKPKAAEETPLPDEKNEDAPVPVKEDDEPKLEEGETIFIPDEIRGVKDEPKAEAPEIKDEPKIENEPNAEMPKIDNGQGMIENDMKDEPAAAPRQVDDGRVKIEPIPDYPVPEMVGARTNIGKFMVFVSRKFQNTFGKTFLDFAKAFAGDLKAKTETAQRLEDADRKTRTVGCDETLFHNTEDLKIHEGNCLRGMLPILRKNVKDMSFFRHPIDKIRGLWTLHTMKNRLFAVNPGITPEDLTKDQQYAERFFHLAADDVKIKEAYAKPETVQREVLAEQSKFIKGLDKLFKREKAPEINNEVPKNEAPIKDLNVTLQPKQ